jgi:hypothetical protein
MAKSKHRHKLWPTPVLPRCASSPIIAKSRIVHDIGPAVIGGFAPVSRLLIRLEKAPPNRKRRS